MLKKLSSDKINGTKNALFFLSRAPTHHSFNFDLRFLYELKRGIFNFRFRSVLLKFTFLFNKMHGLFKTLKRHLKRHNSFQNENNRKATNNFAPRPLISNKKF